MKETTLQWSRCGSCDLTFQNPRLDEQSILSIYHGSDYWDKEAYASYAEGDAPRIAQSVRRLDTIRKVTGLPGGRVLDVGCATGFFGFAASQAGFDVVGVDPSPEMIEVGRSKYGLEMRCGTLEAVELEEGHYDLVTLWGTDSHFLNPLDGFSKLAKSLEPGGFLAMNYQNFHHWVRFVFPGLKRSWNALYNFSDRSFDVMLERVGLTLRYRRTEWQLVSVDHLLRVLKLWRPERVRRRVVLVPAVSFPLVIAQKLDGRADRIRRVK